MTVFSFVDASVRPGDSLSVFALDDDYSLGILSSGIHRMWFEVRCSTLETRLRYTPTTVWDTFPWPQTPTDADVSAVSAAAKQILELRQHYLEQRITLKKQYDALRLPGKSALRDAHEALDRAVFDTYKFDPEEDTLTQLLALNHTVAEVREVERRGPGAAGLSGARLTEYRLR